MPMPEQGTQEYKDLVAETGGAAALPGFNYEAHIAATRNADGTPKVIEPIPQQTTAATIDPVVNGQKPTPTNTSNFTVILTNPPAKMPSPGTVEYEQLLKETGGASAAPGFGYEGHIRATRGASAGAILSDSNRTTTTPTQVQNGFTVILTNPPAKMPSPGTIEYEQLLKETGGASANPGFSYEGHIQATRGVSAGTILSDSNKTQTTPTQVQNGFAVILTNPPAKMPNPGTVEYEQLLKETGGASANPGFSYEGHIQATRGDSAIWILNPDIPRPAKIDLSSLISKTTTQSDAIIGTSLDDLIGTSKGTAVLTGGDGADKFVFNQRDSFGTKGADSITDFDPQEGDQLIISKDALPGLSDTPVFELTSSRKEFKLAQKSDTELIYYQPTGELFYDENGSRKGFGKGGLFAVIDGAPDLTAENLGLL